VHLGTYGCHAKELLQYLKSLDPKEVVLNGDIVDIWQFSKNYFPKTHLKVINHLLKWSSKGIKVHYITGNHDEFLRKFDGTSMGGLEIKNKLVLELQGQKTWIFHGDVFDVTMQYSKWLARLGAVGYDTLILINRAVNWTRMRLGQDRISFSKQLKEKVKKAVSFINSFEHTVAEIALENQVGAVVCGHIHHPIIKDIETPRGTVTYLNSGDWVESLTALEYHKGSWSLYQHDLNEVLEDNDTPEAIDRTPKELFADILTNIKTKASL
jgi:UDP-2,3-diacylglucosamine pyrophosphatase LpxH